MNKPVVLFVDDDRYEMLGLTERLEASGFMVEPMFSSSSALDRLKRGLRPDLIISDLIMATSPDASPNANRYVGIDFCRTVSELDIKVPIIVLTVVTDPIIQSEARKYARTLIVKPVNPPILVRSAHEILKLYDRQSR